MQTLAIPILLSIARIIQVSRWYLGPLLKIALASQLSSFMIHSGWTFLKFENSVGAIE
jgi:hypothetical protein